MQLFTEPISVLGLMSTNMNTSTQRQNQVQTQHLRNPLGKPTPTTSLSYLSYSQPALRQHLFAEPSQLPKLRNKVCRAPGTRTGLGVAGRFRVQGLGFRV